MTRVALPAWTASGIIPPVSTSGPTSAERSPYVVSLSEFVLRFASSAKRQQILSGLLRYRSRLHAAGLTSGFQWLDGSFIENIELVESRDPNDLDVVTFYSLPHGVTQTEVQTRAPDAFPMTVSERTAFKTVFCVDPYLVNLETPSTRLIRLSTYWYSMWSHRRDLSWKGYLQVDLDPIEDAHAAGHLSARAHAGGTP
jgi:hypothetical protein